MNKRLQLSMIILGFQVPLFSQKILLEQVKNYIGKQDTVKVCGKIFNGRFLNNTKKEPTLLNMGGFYPDQKLTVVIFGENRKNFPPNPEKYYENANVCVTGLVETYNGNPEIIVKNGNQIEIEPLLTVDGNIAEKKNVKQNAATSKNTITKNDNNKIKDAIKEKTEVKKTGKIRVQQTNREANLRSGPSPDFPVVTTIAAGNAVNVIFSNNGWSKVEVIIRTKNSLPISKTGYLNNAFFE